MKMNDNCKECVYYNKHSHNKKYKGKCFCNFKISWVDLNQAEDCCQFYDGCCDDYISLCYQDGWN